MDEQFEEVGTQDGFYNPKGSKKENYFVWLVKQLKGWPIQNYLLWFFSFGFQLALYVSFPITTVTTITLVGALLGTLCVLSINAAKSVNGWLGILSAICFIYASFSAKNYLAIGEQLAYVVTLDLPVLIPQLHVNSQPPPSCCVPYFASHSVRAKLPEAQWRLNPPEQCHHIQVLDPSPKEESILRVTSLPQVIC